MCTWANTHTYIHTQSEEWAKGRQLVARHTDGVRHNTTFRSLDYICFYFGFWNRVSLSQAGLSSSCLRFLSAGITGIDAHIQLLDYFFFSWLGLHFDVIESKQDYHKPGYLNYK